MFMKSPRAKKTFCIYNPREGKSPPYVTLVFGEVSQDSLGHFLLFYNKSFIEKQSILHP